jgi:para-aminobenzoate synthetase component 1
VLTPPRAPSGLAERARWEWWSRDGGDPIALATAFLKGHGFAVRPLGGPCTADPAIAGATLLLGAAALPADLAGLPAAAPSPCPEVPDAAVVVYGTAPQAPGTRPDAAAEPARIGPWTPSWSRADHAAAVDRVRAAIARGDLYQANVVGHRSAPYDGPLSTAATAVHRVASAPFAGSLAGEGWSVHSASPELFLEVGESVVRVRPIKGTAADPAVLRASLKDRAEHVMIVDLERNDLGRVAVTGSVRVPLLYDVVRLAGVWHAESTVEAELRPGVGLDDVLAATFPGGSVTGAPKRAALAAIHAIEPVGRGPSMGAFGWVTPAGRVELGLSIRTFAVAGGRIHLWTGGGVTWGSDPGAEVAEAEAKAAPLLAALAAAAAGPDQVGGPDRAASPDDAGGPDQAGGPDRAASPDDAGGPDQAGGPDRAASPDDGPARVPRAPGDAGTADAEPATAADPGDRTA